MTAAALALVAIYDAVALLLLYQWNSPAPWSRLDLFSGGYLALSTFLAVMQAASMPRIAPSPQALHIFTSQHVDPASKYWILCLSVAELTVFYDYGHLRLTPYLERGFLQGMGLGLYIGAVIWMAVTGRYLARMYQPARKAGNLLTEGPYAAMRHPLYSALIASRLGFALLLASVIAWFLTAVWLCRINHRIRREEAHLRGEFGDAYEIYARNTPALIHASVAGLFRRSHQSTTEPSSESKAVR